MWWNAFAKIFQGGKKLHMKRKDEWRRECKSLVCILDIAEIGKLLVGFLEKNFVEFGKYAREVGVDNSLLLGSRVQRSWFIQ